MDALERYYNEYLLGYNAGSNISWYDADYQLTMDRIELILDKGYMDGDDAEFVRSILPEIENEQIREDVAKYLEEVTVI
jgi:hypothetical protein